MYISQSEEEKLVSKIKELRDLAMSLSFKYLHDNRFRQQFNTSIYNLSQQVNDNVHNNCLSFEGGIDIIQGEINDLKKQQDLIVFNNASQYAAIKLEKKDNFKHLVLAQVGFVGGGVQVYTGGSVCLASFGMVCGVWGGPLVLHGLNNLWENGYYLIFKTDSPGWIRQGYRKTANVVGMKDAAGDTAFAVVDLTLSVYGLTKREFFPRDKSWKLWRTMNSDFVLGWQNMGVVALSSEVIVDAATVYSLSGIVDK